MSGRIKHEQRSHKTCNKNYSEFRRFAGKAIRTSEQKGGKKSIAERIANLFKHQDR